MTRRFGTIRYFAYAREDRSQTDVLIARVDLFRRTDPTNYDSPTIDPRRRRAGVFFVRACNLGQVVGFAPVALPGDGKANATIDFWNRPQVVVYCYHVVKK